MPNHIVNEIRIHGIESDALLPLISGRRSIDFATLVPLPINHWAGSVSLAHEESFPGTHLDDARRMWGTKWNAYALNDHSVAKDGDDMVLTFETAWGPPRGWVVALFNTLNCKITHFWQDEGRDSVWRETYTPARDGGFIGPEWKSEEVLAGSDDYRRLYKLQWGVETPEELAE